jgi:hypothetical protein
MFTDRKFDRDATMPDPSDLHGFAMSFPISGVDKTVRHLAMRMASTSGDVVIEEMRMHGDGAILSKKDCRQIDDFTSAVRVSTHTHTLAYPCKQRTHTRAGMYAHTRVGEIRLEPAT